MNGYSKDALYNELKRDEGYEEKPYLCSANKLTIGIGHNLEDRGLSESQIESIFWDDIQVAERDLNAIYPDWRELSDARQRVLLNMVFNLGRTTLSKFVKMWAAIKEERWERAAAEMLDSKWANQVGDRAKRLAVLMING